MNVTTCESLRQLIALLDEATGGTGRARTDAEHDTPHVLTQARRHLASRGPDPDAARHYAELIGDDRCAEPTCLRRARDNGWCFRHYPDEVAIQRAMTGERLPLMPNERSEVFLRLAAKGLTPAQISTRVGVNRESVKRVLMADPEMRRSA